ncbi:MAG: glutamine-hydrolyzing GMP synthase [Candidatus Neomarinimicrobiota bacterium]|nr:glutamine-hydrolyzing GMP synthase [Candidatus Neomarinimicrobiota bacterium]
MLHKQTVLIIDYGSQYTQLIARRIREQNVYSEIVSHLVSSEEIRQRNPKAVVLSGGPDSVYSEGAPTLDPLVMELGVPVLGICYGFGLLMTYDGGVVMSNGQREYGFAELDVKNGSRLLNGISEKSQVWMSHGDAVDELPENWSVLARSGNGVLAAAERNGGVVIGTQFHPEVVHTVDGKKIISNFLFDVAGCEKDWTPASFVESTISEIREIVGEENVLCGVSGGVDSAVLAKLIHEAVGNQLRCVFVDHGLLRKNEADYISGRLAYSLGFEVEYHDFSKIFLSHLDGIVDPEEKRRIIGEQFIRSFESAVQSDADFRFLGQGTLYPDIIESGGVRGTADIIKSHHNVGGLPDDMEFELLEPLRELFKDEVREVGKELGLPNDVLGRHPFPGPGLGVRIIGKITKQRVNILQEADHIFIEALRDHNIYDEIWQAFAVLVPVKTVGVMGDERTYANLIALRAVTSVDGMTADWYRLPEEVIVKVSNKIVNSVPGVNRVVYDVSSKPPSTIEWE